LIYGLKLYVLAAIQQEIEELHGVFSLLLALLPHPTSKPRKLSYLKRACHRKIKIGRVELVLDLLV
jgi:hypothetical protein